MRLTVEGQPATENPRMEEIAKALASLDGRKTSFAILERNGMTYLQVAGSADGGLSLEYQDGSPAAHYQCPSDLSLRDAIKAFQLYAKGGNEWQFGHEWKLMNIHARGRAKGGRRLPKPLIPTSPFYLVLYGIVVAYFLTIFLGAARGGNQDLWVRVSFAFLGLFFAMAPTSALLSGHWGRPGTQSYISRADSPFLYWLGIVIFYALSTLPLLVIRLSMRH